jgi:hypothetical protein
MTKGEKERRKNGEEERRKNREEERGGEKEKRKEGKTEIRKGGKKEKMKGVTERQRDSQAPAPSPPFQAKNQNNSNGYKTLLIAAIHHQNFPAGIQKGKIFRMNDTWSLVSL